MLPPGYWLDTVDSTMDEARRLIAANQVKGCAFVVANHQTQGRGTRGRQWSSPEGKGLYVSVIHQPLSVQKPFFLTPYYTLAAGIACVEALQAVCNITCRLKPINDLYIHNRKLGGILVESEVSESGINWLITGIGLNIESDQHAGLDRLPVEPISIQDVLTPTHFAHFKSDVLLSHVILKLNRYYNDLFEGEAHLIQERWQLYQIEQTNPN